MRIEKDGDGIKYTRENGKVATITISCGLPQVELTEDEKMTYMYNKTKNDAIKHFMTIWECRNSGETPVYSEDGYDITTLNEDADDYPEKVKEIYFVDAKKAIPPDREEHEFIGFELAKRKVKRKETTLVQELFYRYYDAAAHVTRYDQYGEFIDTDIIILDTSQVGDFEINGVKYSVRERPLSIEEQLAFEILNLNNKINSI
jgi:hypothetical protein